MASQQTGAPKGADQPGAATARPSQMEASQPPAPRQPRTQAAFGSGGGAAIVFRDLASI